VNIELAKHCDIDNKRLEGGDAFSLLLMKRSVDIVLFYVFINKKGFKADYLCMDSGVFLGS
jgi:hypothetical protein